MRLPPPPSPSLVVVMAALGAALRSGGGDVHSCGGTLTDSRGVLTTPNFPDPPPVPLYCNWIINASWAEDHEVTVYLTQQYVLVGLLIFDYYTGPDGDKIGEEQLFGEDDNVMETEYVRSNRPFVVVELRLDSLENNHLRVLEDLREVYGFNITYEVTHKEEPSKNSCSPMVCSFVGQCRVSQDFRNYSCDCPENFYGPNCTWGPLCRGNPCQNGADCWTTGTESIVCSCPNNYTGVFCQYPPIDITRECEDDDSDERCSSGSVIKPGRLLYTVNVSLLLSRNNKSDSCDQTSLRTFLLSLTEEALQDFRNNLSLSLNTYSKVGEFLRQYEAYNFEIVDITSDGNVTFQFTSYEKNAVNVSKMLGRLLEAANAAPGLRWSSENCTESNIYLSRDDWSFQCEPALHLQKVALNYDGALAPGSQAVFSCVVSGSTNVTFLWYKENHLVIPGPSRIWTQTHVDPKGSITSLLGLDNLSLIDDGRWTCKVSDGRFQQSRSAKLNVLQSPAVRMQPPAASAPKGSKVFLSCLLTNHDHQQSYTYSWSRNGVPFKSGGDQIYETLNFPSGCLLRLQNINESATYTCEVNSNSGVGKASSSARVEVILKNTALCAGDGDWPEVPVGAVAMIECPEGREGSVASRRCSLGPDKAPQWTDDDYSACLVKDAVRLQDDLNEISVGYSPSTPSKIVRDLHHVTRNVTSLLARQGEAILGVAMVAWQMAHDDPEIHREMLRMIDLLLSFPRALASPKVVNDIVRVSEKTAIAQLKRSDVETSPVHLNQLSISVTRPNRTNSVLRVEDSRPRWSSSFQFSELEVPLPIPLMILQLQSLENIIPYNSQLNLSNVFYQILSTIAITSLPKSRDTSEPPAVLPPVEITFEDLSFNLSSFLDENRSGAPYWNVTCAFSRNLTSSYGQWDLGSCVTSILRTGEGSSARGWLPWRRANALVARQSKVTVRCLCPVPGANAVLLAGFTQKPDSGAPSVAVILALWCCAVEATAALVLPFVISWRENDGKPNTESAAAPAVQTVQNSGPAAATTKSAESNVFMAFRVTSCTNTALLATVMALTMCKWDTNFPGVLLQSLLLLGISLPVAHLYLVAVELGAFPVLPVCSFWSRQYSRSHAVAVVLSIGPVVVFLVLWLSIRDLRSTLSQCWTSWLEWGEPVCWALAIPSSLVATAGVVMTAMTRRLASIATYTKRVHTDVRCGLMLRLCALLVCQLAFLISAVLYTSTPGLASHVALVFSSFLLGYSLLVCYVLRLEKQWALLSVSWCNGEDPLDAPPTARTSTSTDAPPPDCRGKWARLCDRFSRQNGSRNQLCTAPTTPALESPDSLRPLIASSKEFHRPSWPQSNGVPKKPSPVSAAAPPLQSQAQGADATEKGLLQLRELETPKKDNGYLYMRGGTKVTCKADVHGGLLGARKPGPGRTPATGTGTGTHSSRTAQPVPQQSTHNAQPQYQFRRRFLRLDDIEESGSAS